MGQAADVTLKLDIADINTNKLGNAYTESAGDVKLVLCVRASVKKDKQEILFTESEFEVTYSVAAKFTVADMRVTRDINTKKKSALGTLSKVNKAYQCNKEYQKITSPEATSTLPGPAHLCRGRKRRFCMRED